MGKKLGQLVNYAVEFNYLNFDLSMVGDLSNINDKDVVIPETPSITISDSVKKIDGGAFNGCNDFTIHAPAGSYAEQYAKDNNINFVVE